MELVGVGINGLLFLGVNIAWWKLALLMMMGRGREGLLSLLPLMELIIVIRDRCVILSLLIARRQFVVVRRRWREGLLALLSLMELVGIGRGILITLPLDLVTGRELSVLGREGLLALLPFVELVGVGLD